VNENLEYTTKKKFSVGAGGQNVWNTFFRQDLILRWTLRISRVKCQLCVWIVAEDSYAEYNIELHLYYDKIN